MEQSAHDLRPLYPWRPHKFHIAVMGTGFTVDTPLKVARYGISSVISLVDDVLIEQMRKFHCQHAGEPYTEITRHDDDPRAHRITAYLDLLDRLIHRQVAELRQSPFVAGSEITRYYELLPDSPLRRIYETMLATTNPAAKAHLQEELRSLAVSGSIDVNIMTKLDRDIYQRGEKLPPEYSDALAALRGFANSTLSSSVVFSAGTNPRLYTYIAQFDDFFPDSAGQLKKKVVLKVTDFRSAAIQGKFLAKRGIWVSEYRIESSLNCGGHAFPAQGNLLGPILEEFRREKQSLVANLYEVYAKSLASRGWSDAAPQLPVRLTVQGGIGTAEENEFLLRHYEVDGTGWATPFMLVPEVTNVDDEHLAKLAAATEDDVYLSDASPLGIPFWNLRTSASEEARRRRIQEQKPGSPCPKGFAAVANMEFTKVPICLASRAYQKLKLKHLPEEEHPQGQLDMVRQDVTDKSCICHDLAGGAILKNGIDTHVTPAVCCGPNIINFSKIATLEEMVGHIYGRLSLLTNSNRPHMFVKELMLYVDHLRKEVERFSHGLVSSTPKYFREFKENLLSGIEYYRSLAEHFDDEQRERLLSALETLHEKIEQILPASDCLGSPNVELCGEAAG